MIKLSKKQKDRFWSKVNKANGCWEWIGAKREGYGRVGFNHKVYSTHRISWELVNGDIPEGMFILHKCDNPSCVNPNHLFIGTKKDNATDRSEKGRSSLHLIKLWKEGKWKPFCGEKNLNSKLKENQIIKIRKLYKTGKYTQKKIGNMFGVSHSNISYIVNGHGWKHFNLIPQT